MRDRNIFSYENCIDNVNRRAIAAASQITAPQSTLISIFTAIKKLFGKPAKSATIMINLRSNYPAVQSEADIFKTFIDNLQNHLLPAHNNSSFLTSDEAGAVATYLNINKDVITNDNKILTCNSGTAAIYTLLRFMRSHVDQIGVEDFTYSGLLTAARIMDLHCVPVSCDEEGFLPSALEEAIKKGIKVFYLQPTIHNPTNRVMRSERRDRIKAILKGKNVLLIEDDAYRFLHPSPPPSFLQLLPRQTIHICSLSKPFSRFLQSCFIIYPKDQLKNIEVLSDTTGANTSDLMRSFSFYLFGHTDFKNVIREKQFAAIELKNQLAPILAPLTYFTNTNSYHIWIRLQPPHNSIAITNLLKTEGILINGGHECSATGDTNYIRIALSAEKDFDTLRFAVERVSHLITSY